MDSLDITVIGFGVINPVGVGANASAAAVRAGINQYADSPLMKPTGEPFKLALVPEQCLPTLNLDASNTKSKMRHTSLYRRILQLGKVALTEACAQVQIQQAIPLFLATPEQRCGRPFPALEPILKDLASEVDYPIDLLTSRVFPLGRAGGVHAIDEAINLLLTSPLESIIVGGIDSFLDIMLLNALDAEERLSSNAPIRGFVPGEGAAFVVLQKKHAPELVVKRPGLAEEIGHLYSQETCLGDGLSNAVNDAVKGLDRPLKTVLCSMNGEPGHVKEWGVSQLRNSASFEDDLDLYHPAECYGDIGAATAVTLLSLSVIGITKGYYLGPLLLWCASDYEQRGAVVISKTKESRNG